MKYNKIPQLNKHERTPPNVDWYNYVVINMDRSIDRMEHYPEIYHRHIAYDGLNKENEKKYCPANMSINKLRMRYNTKEKKKKCVYGAIRSHLDVLKDIWLNRRYSVVVMEDDNEMIDKDIIVKLNEEKFQGMCYLGGWIVPRLMKDIKTKDLSHLKETFKKGVNKIDYDMFRILTCRCYYISDWSVARDMFLYIVSRKTWKAIDLMYPESQIPQYFYFPAVGLQRVGTESQIGNRVIQEDMREYGI